MIPDFAAVTVRSVEDRSRLRGLDEPDIAVELAEAGLTGAVVPGAACAGRLSGISCAAKNAKPSRRIKVVRRPDAACELLGML